MDINQLQSIIPCNLDIHSIITDMEYASKSIYAMESTYYDCEFSEYDLIDFNKALFCTLEQLKQTEIEWNSKIFKCIFFAFLGEIIAERRCLE